MSWFAQMDSCCWEGLFGVIFRPWIECLQDQGSRQCSTCSSAVPRCLYWGTSQGAALPPNSCGFGLPGLGPAVPGAERPALL